MQQPQPSDDFSQRSYHWVIVLAGIVGLFASLGLGRFSLGMMLPAMGEGLSLSYGQMGVISTLNFCGYLAAVLFAGKMTQWLGSRYLISMALFTVGISMILVGCTEKYSLIAFLYFVTGVGSALSNVPIMALVSVWFDAARRGRVAGLFVTGNGLGILFSGKSVPAINHYANNWQSSWQLLGGVVLLVSLLCLFLIRNRPQARKKEIPLSKESSEKNQKNRTATGNLKLLLHCGGIYFLFGFSYVIYVTFMVTSLVQERGITEQAAGDLWSWVGLLSLISGPLFGYISDKFGRKTGLVSVFLIQTTAYLLIAAPLPMATVYLSICCFSIVAWSIPSIMAALVGDYYGPEKSAAMFGYVTFIFGIGQIIGPAAAGYLAEFTHSFSTSFFMAGIAAAVAIVFSWLLPATNSTG